MNFILDLLQAEFRAEISAVEALTFASGHLNRNGLSVLHDVALCVKRHKSLAHKSTTYAS